jgi:tetratricopeptide (TPR) repeat protein
MCELGERIGEKGQLLLGLTELCQLHFVRGEASEGLELATRCLGLAEETLDPESLAVAAQNAAFLAHSCGNLRQAVSHSQDALHYNDRAHVDVLQIGLLFNTAVALVLALDLHLLGRVSEALTVAEQGLRYARESKHGFSICFALCYARMGQTEKALAMLNETLEHIERSGEKLQQAEMLRLKGEVLLLMGDRSVMVEAEKCFRDALEVARAQEAKWWELRATASLARLLRDTNRLDEARTMLGEIYNWFTEGFDLPDLKEAKALLDELSC